ncbi:TonB-dependent receptor domain-containing protein [Pontibacter toksunensis]|uniref:TonB-dependent receptor domain-containing protein n=1 Tax=Pontibacter toksunensis TaxID=1332631 RepID=A0ABW6C0X8_9BACT
MKRLFLSPTFSASRARRILLHLFVFSWNGRNMHWLWLLVITATTGFGQSRISGQVQGEEGSPLPFATVLLLSSKDSSVVSGAITTEAGDYVVEKVGNGSYCIAASMVGYHKVYSAHFVVSETNQSLRLPLLVARIDARQLNEVIVTAQKPLFEQQLDRLVVNVQSSITAAGATALEVLERSPGILVNRQDNTLSLLGKAGVVVMVNGKITRLPAEAVLQMLAGMNAGNIEKIELYTTPPASFDAEGTGGVVNIVLKQNQEYGTNGAYSLTMGYGWYARPGATFNINHRKEKLNLFADGSFLWDHYWFSAYTNRSFLHHGERVRSSTHSDRDTHHMTYNARLGFEYSLGANTSLNGLVAGFNNRAEQFARNKAEIYHAEALSTSIHIKDHEINNWRHLMGNLNLQHAFADKSRLTLDLDYLLYHHRNPHWYENQYQYWPEGTEQLELMNATKRTPIHIWVGKADYNWEVNEKLAMETGVKGTWSTFRNDVLLEKLVDTEWQPQDEFSQDVNMREDIGAAYLNSRYQLDARTKLQAGLRWEYTQTDLTSEAGENILNRRYHNFFPSLFLSRDLNENNSLQLSYSRRITRPTYGNLAPFVTFLDPNSSMFGNSSLRPAISDAVQAVYQWKNSYTVTLQYSHDKDALSWTMVVDPQQNKQYVYTENIKGITTYSLSMNLPVTLTEWWQTQNSLMGNWQQNETNYQGENLQVEGYTGQVNSTHTFTLPRDFSVEASGLYKSPSFMSVLRFRSFGSVNLGLQKKLKNEGGTFRLTVTDLFWTMRMEAVNDVPAMNLYQNIGFLQEPRVLRLTYSRNFGNKQVKAQKERATGSEEERKRAN